MVSVHSQPRTASLLGWPMQSPILDESWPCGFLQMLLFLRSLGSRVKFSLHIDGGFSLLQSPLNGCSTGRHGRVSLSHRNSLWIEFGLVNQRATLCLLCLSRQFSHNVTRSDAVTKEMSALSRLAPTDEMPNHTPRPSPTVRVAKASEITRSIGCIPRSEASGWLAGLSPTSHRQHLCLAGVQSTIHWKHSDK